MLPPTDFSAAKLLGTLIAILQMFRGLSDDPETTGIVHDLEALIVKHDPNGLRQRSLRKVTELIVQGGVKDTRAAWDPKGKKGGIVTIWNIRPTHPRVMIKTSRGMIRQASPCDLTLINPLPVVKPDHQDE